MGSYLMLVCLVLVDTTYSDVQIRFPSFVVTRPKGRLTTKAIKIQMDALFEKAKKERSEMKEIDQKIILELESIKTHNSIAPPSTATGGDSSTEGKLVDDGIEGVNKDQMNQMKNRIDNMLQQQEKMCNLLDRQNSYTLKEMMIQPAPKHIKFVKAFASSMYSTLINASLAIDGNRNGDFRQHSCASASMSDFEYWWQGTLEAPSEIHEITIYNRVDCCADRLKNFKIEGFMDDPRINKAASPSTCKEITEAQLAYKTTIVCDKPIDAKYIKISKLQPDKQIAAFCEIEAGGFKFPKKYIGPTHQSSMVSESKAATMALDDDTSTCSETDNEAQGDPWWLIDLRTTLTVIGVRITNRQDEKYIWMSGIQVTVYDKIPAACSESSFLTCTSRDAVVGRGENVTLTCEQPVSGRYLKITKTNRKIREALSLCDVVVLTKP